MDTIYKKLIIRYADPVRDWSVEQGKIIVTIPVPAENTYYQFAFTREEMKSIADSMQNFLDSNPNL